MQTDKGNILISGASGLIGSALGKALEAEGYRVWALSRRDDSAPFYYDQQNRQMHLSQEIPLLAVINLAGANISDGRWTEARKQE
ncbi:MAG: NAD-dependent epimerase/dehydratase family protein, partial [Pseudomonadales bacterium]|nr:NAD-dependent epimerase/dehydratase family protein [Pseudomonadales bacterium]